MSKSSPTRANPVQDEVRLLALLDELTFHERGREAAPAVEVPTLARGVVGVSLDPATPWATQWADALGALFGLDLTLVHVEAPLSTGYTLFGAPAIATAEELTDTAEREGRRLLDEAATRLRGVGLGVSVRHARGSPVRELLKVARSEDADLIVVGSPRRGAIDRLILGNVADGIKNHADSHVLLARGAPVPGDILCPVDGSWMSHRAAGLALRIARAWGARLHVAHVLERPPNVDDAKAAATLAALRTRLELPWGDLPEVDFELHLGDPAAVIEQQAIDLDAKLVVMGHRGLGGLRSLVAGSVANAVSHRIDRSLLLVKGSKGWVGEL